ncbi:MAG: hypothetical protein M1476_07440 [Candidatus Thermoplasmatota archaeon]|nr:hypothetical protein [Candidatus Thermoplasmatota archaeon]
MAEKTYEHGDEKNAFRKVRLLSIAALTSLIAILPFLLIHMSEYLKTHPAANSSLTYLLIFLFFALLLIPTIYGLLGGRSNPVWIIFFLIPVGAGLEFFFDVLAPFFLPFVIEIGICVVVSDEYRGRRIKSSIY